MINTSEDLNLFLKCDKLALRKHYKYPRLLSDEVWRFEIVFRKYEYYANTNKKIRGLIYHFLYHRASIKLGFSIPINTFGPGLSIAHYGTIVVNGNARIGKNCRIQENVTIGATNGSAKAPIIGNNVFIGSGAKVIGDIRIADDICIGAGAVVVDSFDEPGITIAGVPAKKISNNNSHSNLSKDLIL